MTQPDRRIGKPRTILRRGRHAGRERRPRHLTATPAATRMPPMLRDLQRARLRQVENLARDRIADRRRQRRPAAPAGRRNMLLHTVRDGRPAQRLAPQATGSTLRRWLLQTVARRRLAAVAAVQTKTTLQRRYPLNKTRVPIPKPSGLQLQTRDLLTRCLGHGHPQRVKRFGMTHPKVDSFSNPRVNPSPTQTSWAVTKCHAMSCSAAPRPFPQAPVKLRPSASCMSFVWTPPGTQGSIFV